MRALWLMLALAACGPSAAPKPAPIAHVAPAASDSVRVALAPPAVGDRRTVTMTARMDAMTILADGSRRPIVVDEQVTAEVEVLLVLDGTEQKLRVTYPVARRMRNMGDIKSKEDRPFAGHTYVVWSVGGAVKATRDDGTALGNVEEIELAEEWDEELGKVDPLLALLAGEPWTLGERRELKAAELKRINFGDDSIQLTTGSITLTGANAATARFELDVVMVGREGGDSIEMPARVTLEVERSGRPTSLKIEGTMKGKTDGVQVAAEVEMSQRWTYP